MENELAQLVHDFYAARRRDDEPAIRRMLAEDVLWHEPAVNDQLGDLYGPEAVIRMIKDARERTNGTFELGVEGVLTNRTHAVALIRWTAKVEGKSLRGSEFAVFRVESGRIREVWFFQEDMRMDQAFWGVAGA